MLGIQATDLGKKYGSQWVFRAINLSIQPAERWRIAGHNGSGKSTLLKILCGVEHATKGAISYDLSGTAIAKNRVALQLSMYAPYLGYYSKFSLKEWYATHFQFRSCLLPGIADCLKAVDLHTHADKKLSELSSGMLQRAAVALMLFTESKLLILDEPTSYQDAGRAEQLVALIGQHLAERTLLLATNLEREAALCTHTFSLG